MSEFKYKDKLKPFVGRLPEMFLPNNRLAFRFVYKDNPEMSYLPPYIKNPKRVLQGDVTPAGYALSFFETADQANDRFRQMEQRVPKIRKSIGDSLASGTISNEDGLITATSANGHFDLFEYTDCNLSHKFKVCAEYGDVEGK